MKPIPKYLQAGAWLGKRLRPLRRRIPVWLVVRYGSLGDALLFTGVLQAIKQQYPGHRIVLATSLRAVPVFERCPAVDSVVVMEGVYQSARHNRCQRFLNAVKIFARTYDGCLLISPLATSEAEAWLRRNLAVKRLYRFTERSVQFPEPPKDYIPVPIDCATHELDRMIPLLRAAGCHAVRTRADIWPQTHLSDADRAWARNRLETAFSPTRNQKSKINHQKSFTLALCPGARFRHKSWGAENYAGLLRLMAQVKRFRDLRVVFLGGPADREIVAEIIRQLKPESRLSKEPVPANYFCAGTEIPRTKNHEPRTTNNTHSPPANILNLAGQADIYQTMAVIEQCDLCIGNDTFGLHAAIAVNTPSVVLMWGGDGDRWAPWGDPEKHRMVRAQVDCGGCGGKCVHSRFECMQRITPEIVAREMDGLSATGGSACGGKTTDCRRKD